MCAYEPLPQFQNTCMILQEVLTVLAANIWSKIPKHFLSLHMKIEEDKILTSVNIEHFCDPVVHPVTGETISKHQTLARYTVIKETWTAWGKELGNLAQGDDKTSTKVMDSLFLMSPDDIRNIPKD